MENGGAHERYGEPFDTIRMRSSLERERVALEIGKLPKLVIVDIDAILPHEEPDGDIAEQLKLQIETSGVLKNPLIATTDHGSVSHILLDGENRYEALRRLGARFVLIQEVDIDNEGIILSTWNHAIEDLDVDLLMRDLSSRFAVTSFDGQFTPSGDFIMPSGSGYAGCIVLPDGCCYGVHGTESLRERVDVVIEIVHRLGWTKKRDRVSYTNMNDLKKHYPNLSALVCYGGFSKGDVLKLAVGGMRFPSGITHFCVPKRALAFNLPLALLQGEGTIEDKHILLQLHMLDRIRSRKIKFYEEPTFYFDD